MAGGAVVCVHCMCGSGGGYGAGSHVKFMFLRTSALFFLGLSAAHVGLYSMFYVQL